MRLGRPTRSQTRPATGDNPVEVWRRGLQAVDARTWLRAAVFGVLAATAIAVPTRLVPNGFFSRMTPTRPLDYVFLVGSSALVGLTLALRSLLTATVPTETAIWSAGARSSGTRAAVSGIGTVFAVGCPVCNKLVVALLGTGGALTFFAPLQPVIGLAATGLLVVGLTRQLQALGATACTRPATGEAW